MFDIGAMEILVIAVLAIIVVGPKDLPVMLRKIGSFVSYFKKMSADFQSHVQETVDQTMQETGVKDAQDMFDDVTKGTWDEEDERRAQENNEHIMRETSKTSSTKKRATKKTPSSSRRTKVSPQKASAQKAPRAKATKSRKKAS